MTPSQSGDHYQMALTGLGATAHNFSRLVARNKSVLQHLKAGSCADFDFTRICLGPKTSSVSSHTMAQNHAASKKRRREPFSVDTKLVEIYEDLASEKDEIRLKSAQALVSQFTPDKNPTDEQVQKALQRLFRGLCSSRKAARIGFSIALTEILTQVLASPRESSDITVSKVMSVWESQSSSSGSESGQVCSTSWWEARVGVLILSTGTTGPPFRTSLWGGSHHQVFYPVQAPGAVR